MGHTRSARLSGAAKSWRLSHMESNSQPRSSERSSSSTSATPIVSYAAEPSIIIELDDTTPC
jgi:hypothetical protein